MKNKHKYDIEFDAFGPCHIRLKKKYIIPDKFNFIEWKHIDGFTKYNKTGCYISKPERYGKPFTFWLDDHNIACFEKVLQDSKRAFDFFLHRIAFKKGMRKIKPYWEGRFPEIACMLRISEKTYFIVINLNDPHDPEHREKLILSESETNDLLNVIKEVKEAYKDYWGCEVCRL